MNSMHSNGEQDRSLHETLDKLGQSYAQLDRDEPPELLDMAILNSAHRAVEKKPQRLKFGWLHGLTTAAVFVLALTLIVHQRENQPAEDITIQFDKLERSRQAEPAKKQSAEDRSRQSLQAPKESAIERMDQPAPVAAGAPQTLEPAARGNVDTQAEEQLRAIIRMQQAGDERWKVELEAFIKSHPDYPLPDELKN